MIEVNNVNHTMVISCDNCTEQEEVEFDTDYNSFAEQIAIFKETGWIIYPDHHGGFLHYCSKECSDKGEEQ